MGSLLPTWHETLGAASIAFSISCGVFGIFTTLIFIYFRRYPKDKVWYKVLVSLLLISLPGRRVRMIFWGKVVGLWYVCVRDFDSYLS